MRKPAFLAALVTALLLTAAAAAQAPQLIRTQLKVGQMAPDFTLPSNQFKPVHLSEYRGKKSVILAFYVLAFTPG